MGVHIYRDLRIRTLDDVYEPSDDSHLLADAVLEADPDRLLEVGTGSGLVAILAARAGADVVATDVAGPAVELARANARRAGVDVSVVRADLLAGVDATAFDLVAFNPPYLPTGPDERLGEPIDRAFDGGRSGRRVVERFAASLPDGPPSALVVASSRQDLDALQAEIRRRGRAATRLTERKLPFERLVVWRLDPA